MTAAAAAVFFMLAAADLALRSRGALQKAEQHASWRDNPVSKAAYFEDIRKLRSKKIQQDSSDGAITPAQAERRQVLETAERDFRVSESSAKQAYLWYRTAAEDFKSPFNPWAADAGKRMAAALDAWRAELKAQGIKTEDWMLQ
jgi:hypothetical protein